MKGIRGVRYIMLKVNTCINHISYCALTGRGIIKNVSHMLWIIRIDGEISADAC